MKVAHGFGRLLDVKRLALALFVTIALCVLLLYAVELPAGELAEELKERLPKLRGLPLLGAFLVYASTYLGRGSRLALLLGGRQSLLHMAGVSARHNLFNLVLPFRSGEAALPWMLKAEAGVPWSAGSGALVVARVLDMTGLAFWASMGLAIYGLGSGEAEQVEAVAEITLGALVLVLLTMRPISRLISARLPGQGRVAQFARGAALHIAQLRLGQLAGALMITLVTWCATYSTYWLLLMAMSTGDPGDAMAAEYADVSFARSLVGTTGLHMSTVLPVNTVGGAGVWEAAWVAGYTLLAGMEEHAALVSGVVSHLANLCFLVLLGGVGWLLRRAPPALAEAQDAPTEPTPEAPPST